MRSFYKPHIFLFHGRWQGQYMGAIRSGKTPKEAYINIVLTVLGYIP